MSFNEECCKNPERNKSSRRRRGLTGQFMNTHRKKEREKEREKEVLFT